MLEPLIPRFGLLGLIRTPSDAQRKRVLFSGTFLSELLSQAQWHRSSHLHRSMSNSIPKYLKHFSDARCVDLRFSVFFYGAFCTVYSSLRPFSFHLTPFNCIDGMTSSSQIFNTNIATGLNISADNTSKLTLDH